MKHQKFNTVYLSVSQKIINDAIDACLSLSEKTRASLSARIGVSLPTAGKVLMALDASGFTEKRLEGSSETAKRSYHRFFSDTLKVLIIDLSEDEYTANLFEANSPRDFFESHICDNSLSVDGNLSVFFSRVLSKAKAKHYKIAAISVILPDQQKAKPSSVTSNTSSTDIDRRLVDAVCAKIFKALPFTYLTKREAIGLAIKYNSAGRLSDSVDTVCLSHGRSPFMAYFGKDGVTIPCDIGNMMISDGLILSDIGSERFNSANAPLLLLKLINLADCAFSPQRYVIEFGAVKFDSELLKSYKSYFDLVGKSAPELITFSRDSSLSAFGAAAFTFAEFIKLHIRSNISQ